MLVDEEEHAEADDRDLRVEIEAAADGEPPEPAVDDRPRHRRGLDPVRPPRARAARRAPTSAPTAVSAARKRKAASVPPASAIGGSDSAPIEPSERDRGLAHAEREAALVGAEPVHDRASARRVDGAARCADEAEEDDELLVARGVRRPDEARARSRASPTVRTTRSPKRSAARPHGRSVSGVPIHDGGEQDADLAEREVVLLAQLREDDRAARSRTRRCSPPPPSPRPRTAHRYARTLYSAALTDRTG